MQEDPDKITYFAATNSRGREVPFGIKRRDRARHMYIIGKTGMGKSTMLENMAIQDVRNGEGFAFIDPHGGTAERIMEYIPEHRIKDVLYFAPFDMEYPVAFNVMEDVGYDKRHLVVSGLLSAFRKIWVDAWSARMEYILSNTLLALLEYDGSTLLDVNRMLVNKAFRKKVVENVTDPIVKSFWVEEFANYTDRYTQDATPAIQNKVGQFTSNPLIRNIVGQPKSSFDIRKMMDEKKILIINLSKGRVGEVNTNLLGSMLVTKIYLAAMSRADTTAKELSALPPFYLYVDEFQSFANQSFADILSEARKYHLNLVIAHQYIEQMEEEVRDAVFGNVGTTVAFRVGPFDAEVLETMFQPQFTQTDLVNLGFAQIYLTLMIDGVGSPPFSATTLPPFDPPPERFTEKTLASSRAQFGKSRIAVEEALKKWNEIDQVPPKSTAVSSSSASSRAPKRSPQTSSYKAPERSPVQAAPPPASATPSPHTPSAHPDPKQLAADIARRHAMAASKAAGDEPQPPAQPNPRPKPPRPPERPPLEGASSLREALQKATALKPESKSEQKGTHAPDLKDTLKSVAPEATASAPKKEEPAASAHTKKKTAELPESVLREMLAVEDGEERK